MVQIYNATSSRAFSKLAGRIRIAFIGVSLFLQMGCNRAAPASMATNEIASPVYELADAIKHPQRFRKLFNGVAPTDEQRKRYGEYAFQVLQIRSVSQSEALLTVVLDDGKADHSVDVEWTVAKDGGKWKLKAAPLP
jgi:hypothetical protein